MIGQAVNQCTQEWLHSLGNEGTQLLCVMLSEKLTRLDPPIGREWVMFCEAVAAQLWAADTSKVVIVDVKDSHY